MTTSQPHLATRVLLLLLAVTVSSAFTSSSFSTFQSSSSLSIHNVHATGRNTALQALAAKKKNNMDFKKFSANIDNNPFNKLPWNVRKEKARQARRLATERAQLHRELGIAEDATYEEIVDATNYLIAQAGNDLKRKIKVEVAKDKILQLRLNERMAGLSTATTTKDAKAQSRFEKQGADADDDDLDNKKKSKNKESTAPAWTRGLVVKPDAKHVKGQVRLWGIVTLIGASFPPAQDYLGRFTWLICVAQLTFRGMPRDEREGGGLGMSFSQGKGGHRKVAFALGFSTWIVGAILVYSLIPAWARGQRWTSTLGFALQNLIFGLVSSYLQPYKG